jgi:hypothetical protein
MFSTLALSALNLIDSVKPRDIPRVEEYITDRVPMLEVVPDLPTETPKVARRKPRKKHVCTWTDQDVWGAVITIFIIGLFIGHCL